MPLWLQAGLWDCWPARRCSSAPRSDFSPVPPASSPRVMAFGGGVLISALAFDLMDEAYRAAGSTRTSIGFLGRRGGLHGRNWYSRPPRREAPQAVGRPAAERKRAAGQRPGDRRRALLDGIPESIAIGVSMIEGGRSAWSPSPPSSCPTSPKGLSSVRRHEARRSVARLRVRRLDRIAVVAASRRSPATRCFTGLPPDVIAATIAVAAGAILAMLSDTMMPEAFESTHDFAGLVTVARISGRIRPDQARRMTTMAAATGRRRTMPLPRRPAPRLARVRQHLPSEHIPDVRRDVQQRLLAAASAIEWLLARASPSPRAAAASAGSSNCCRGIVRRGEGRAAASRSSFPRWAATAARRRKARREILRRLGVTEESVGAPVRATMETVDARRVRKRRRRARGSARVRGGRHHRPRAGPRRIRNRPASWLRAC